MGREEYWLAKFNTANYRSWAGYAFEAICLKHASQIRRALGIEEIVVDVGTWQFVPRKGASELGAQVDLLFDRSDGVIQLCEINYCSDVFTVSKAYARELKRKIDVFERITKTQKQVFLALVTSFGLHANTWSEDLITNVVTADSLFG